MENLTETKQSRHIYKRLLAVAVLVVMFGAGYGVGDRRLELTRGQITINRGQPARSADYSLLWDALDLLNEKFAGEPLDQQQLLYGAVAGLVQAANDPYTVFLNPEEAKQFEEELGGTFEGIGAEIGMRHNQLVIIAPLEGMPAASAGLLPGDIILAVDGEPTTDLSIDQAVLRIRGPAGTTVALTVLHPAERQPREITITRARIEVHSVNLETRELDGRKIGIVKISRFGEDTKGLFDHTVDILLAGNFHGLILDLRNNPGGFLETSIQIASNWIEQGQTVVKEVNYKDEEKVYPAKGLARLQDIPTVVLINNGSASASEIVAGALQDYDLATLVGVKTFGKGSVQELSDLKGGSSIKVTTAKWQTPLGRNIHENGLEPDVVVERTAEDIDADRDPQLDKALELLR